VTGGNRQDCDGACPPKKAFFVYGSLDFQSPEFIGKICSLIQGQLN
jgi:hypothetical protein